MLLRYVCGSKLFLKSLFFLNGLLKTSSVLKMGKATLFYVNPERGWYLRAFLQTGPAPRMVLALFCGGGPHDRHMLYESRPIRRPHAVCAYGTKHLLQTRQHGLFGTLEYSRHLEFSPRGAACTAPRGDHARSRLASLHDITPCTCTCRESDSGSCTPNYASARDAEPRFSPSSAHVQPSASSNRKSLRCPMSHVHCERGTSVGPRKKAAPGCSASWSVFQIAS